MSDQRSKAECKAETVLGLGYVVGASVLMKMSCFGADCNDDEHTTPVGATGRIDNIEIFDGVQGLVVTIVIPVSDNDPDLAIVQVFDEADREPRFPFELLPTKRYHVTVIRMVRERGTATITVPYGIDPHTHLETLRESGDDCLSWDSTDLNDVSIDIEPA